MAEPRILGSRYELSEMLGYGGMAEVRRGRDVRLGRDVAVKVLRADLARDPAFQARFRREAQSAASLNHPSIVAVYDTGEDDVEGTSIPYIVMEYVAGRTLRDLIRNDGRLLPERALEITSEVLTALDYSHRAGIVHRDIKPANVMLAANGQIKVMDFGIARAVTASAATMTQTAAVMGTAQYLSPEQARGDSVDARSDVYSTGCLLYELLTGEPPFTGDSPVAVAYQHVREDPIPPSTRNPDVTPAIDAIVLKALAKNPENRYQSATEMREDIERALAGRPVYATPLLNDQTMATAATTAYPTVPAYDVTPPDGGSKRRRALAYVLLTLAVLGVFVAALVAGKALVGKNAKKYAVPDLTGKTQQQAQQALQNAHLKLGQVHTDHSKRTPNVVYNQTPLPGVVEPSGSAVEVWISLGVQRVQVPDVTNMSLDDARKKLEGDGLRAVQSDTRASSQPAGTVLATDPPAGQTVDAGTVVHLTIASGNVQVPSVKGLDYTAAQEQLVALGLKVKINFVPSTATPDSVVNQNPTPGHEVPIGTLVTLDAATPPPPSTSAPPTTSPAPSPSTSTSSSPSTSPSTSATPSRSH